MGEAARRQIDAREDYEPGSTGGAAPVDWFVDPVDQARGDSGVTTLDDLATAFLAAHPEVAGDAEPRGRSRDSAAHVLQADVQP